MAPIRAPRGVPDILPPDSELLSEIEAWARTLFDRYGYRRIETPVFEATELFVRGAGESSDIVRKQMYTFADQSGRSMTLRPEGTAGVARAVIEHELHKSMPLPLRLSYVATMFRYETPQGSRKRQFGQLGIECFGSSSPVVDAEVIAFGRDLYKGLGLEPELLLNTLGCAADRARYAERLREVLSPRAGELCEDCRVRLDLNPLRILDCNVPSCQALVAGVEPVSSFLCEECREHFASLRTLLDALGIAHTLDERLVRGLDYYTRTLFEFDLPSLGARSALGGGGRYDGLTEQLGGPPLPAVGMSPGLVPMLDALRVVREPDGWRPDVYVAWLDGVDATLPVKVAADLRNAGVRVTTAEEAKSLKAQLRTADRLGASRVVILGPRDVSKGVATVRDLERQTQEEVALDGLVELLS